MHTLKFLEMPMLLSIKAWKLNFGQNFNFLKDIPNLKGFKSCISGSTVRKRDSDTVRQ